MKSSLFCTSDAVVFWNMPEYTHDSCLQFPYEYMHMYFIAILEILMCHTQTN